MLLGTSLDVDRELDTLADLLASELAGQVPRTDIEHSISVARQDFGDPPITQFLPILIERRVRAGLRS